MLPLALADLYRRLQALEGSHLRSPERLLERTLPLVGYSEDGVAEQLQEQLTPWLQELANSEPLLREVVEALRGAPPALQEALHWAYSYESANAFMSLGDSGRLAALHAAFVPFFCTGHELEAPVSTSPIAGLLAEQTQQHGLAHPDELLLILPFFIGPRELASLPTLNGLLDEAWDIAAQAWGPGVVPSVQAHAHWEAQWAARPNARRWRAPSFGPGDVRFAMIVVASPELGPELRVPLEPWQELERHQLRLRDRFAPETHRVHSDASEIEEEAAQARLLWTESIIEALHESDYPALLGSDPRDAYSAMALAATNAAADLVGEAEVSAGRESLVLLVDAAGMSVELAGRRRTLPWAPQGPLMPGMVRAVAVRLSRAVGREVNLSVALENEGWALIQSAGGPGGD